MPFLLFLETNYRPKKKVKETPVFSSPCWVALTSGEDEHPKVEIYCSSQNLTVKNITWRTCHLWWELEDPFPETKRRGDLGPSSVVGHLSRIFCASSWEPQWIWKALNLCDHGNHIIELVHRRSNSLHIQCLSTQSHGKCRKDSAHPKKEKKSLPMLFIWHFLPE